MHDHFTTANLSPAMNAQAAIDRALLRAEWQSTLFGRPNRARLADCVADWPSRTVHVRAHRNHGIDPVVSAMPAYAAWNGLSYRWSVGAYDDSFAFEPQSPEADVELIWLDTVRLDGLAAGELAPWLIARLRALRSQTTRPIVVVAWPLDQADRDALQAARLPGVEFVDLAPLASAQGSSWTDARTESISGTRLSNHACLQVARELACRWLPASVIAPVKCVAVDLDGTLYSGVLGEDGSEGIRITDGHRALQDYLSELRRKGMLLALVSHNVRDDVEALFRQCDEFTLRLEDFSAIEISWDDKAAALARVANSLRIGLDAIVFVDDNPGELASVASRCPVATVHARADGHETMAALDHVAGVFQWRESAEDRLRAQDLDVSAQRDALRDAAVSPGDYLRSLQVRVQYHVDASAHLPRIAELLRKTNQFNLSLRRMSESEIADRIRQHPRNVVAASVSDRLSDSGLIAALVGTIRGDTLHVEELAFSCRALGRRLEDSVLTQALLLMAEGRSPAQVSFDIRDGPRNAPARQWLAAYSGGAVAPAAGIVSMPMAVIASKSISTDFIGITTPATCAA